MLNRGVALLFILGTIDFVIFSLKSCAYLKSLKYFAIGFNICHLDELHFCEETYCQKLLYFYTSIIWAYVMFFNVCFITGSSLKLA